MDIANHLAVIDRLCARDFPAEHGRTDVGAGGPGYLIAELRGSGASWQDDGAGREEAAAQYEADRDALAERLTERWGPPDRFSLYSILERTIDGGEAGGVGAGEGGCEDGAQPWTGLSGHVPDVHLWRVPGAGRWIALGVSRWSGEPPFRLLAVITDTDPP
ncbi:hypothetical protein [Streptomyces sp. NPDC040750]|uniref:hypothetical protein n=1 Tax=Streptomyces sp. NPDC040750 TaxID=3154491 RepID=UPI0033F6F200